MSLLQNETELYNYRELIMLQGEQNGGGISLKI